MMMMIDDDEGDSDDDKNDEDDEDDADDGDAPSVKSRLNGSGYSSAQKLLG